MNFRHIHLALDCFQGDDIHGLTVIFDPMKRIAILASGSGTNAENLVLYFRQHPLARVVMMACDRKQAKVFERMHKLDIPSFYIISADLKDDGLLNLLKEQAIDLVVLAGFLKLVPEKVIHAYRGRIINIHPALLPKYGGKGMFGMHVHEAVVKAGEGKTGITIHHVNEHFDEGEIIARFEVPLKPDDTPESVAEKIHRLEMKHYPEVVENLILGMK